MFAQADEDAQRNGESDLVPYWIAPGPCRVQRRAPMLPYASEGEACARLKRARAAYRVVFGQPRQEELIALLESAQIGVDALRGWAVDLSPPASKDMQGSRDKGARESRVQSPVS